jgi:tetratricopeptide (TPR) repeat protein
MRLSLCMIVKNEAENLPRCLESVKDAVDEMVVLDTGSTDATIEIARSYGAQIAEFEWCDDFAVARNEALKHVTADWVLVLDADERLVTAVVPLLRQLIEREDALVINLVRQEIGATQSPYSLVSRLFRHHPAVQFSRPYHAMIDDSVAQLLQHEPDWQVLNCADVAILHDGYQPGAITSRDKLQTAKITMERAWRANPEDPYVCSKLGALYVQMDDFTKGIQLLERGLRSFSTPTAPILYELHYHLGIAYTRLKQYQLAEQHYQTAAQQPILDRLKLGAYNNLGNLLKGKGDLFNAEKTYQTCLEIDPNFAIGYYNLGMTLKAKGQLEPAITHYQTAIQLDPNYAEAYQNLGVVLLKLGRVPESLQAFQQAVEIHQRQNPDEANRLRQGLAEMGLRLGA